MIYKKPRVTIKSTVKASARLMLLMFLGSVTIVVSLVFGSWASQETQDGRVGFLAGSFVFMCMAAALGIGIGLYLFMKRERRNR